MIACLGLFQCGGYVQLATTDKLRPYIQSQPIVVQKEKSPADDLSFRVVNIFASWVIMHVVVYFVAC